MKLKDFDAMKKAGRPIKMITCYDYWTAKILATTPIDCVLVGDSAAMVMHGAPTTLSAEVGMLTSHIRAVKSGIGEIFVIGDLPFMSYRKSLSESMSAVEQFMRAGANAIKLEGVIGNEALIEHIIASGVPVMGHLGFTPQSIHMFGSTVQGKSDAQAQSLLEAAKTLEALGCFAMVLECIPATLADTITQQVGVPTIGIGAGPHTSGQVLVLQDLIGADPDFHPKFLKKYMDAHGAIKEAVTLYCQEVQGGQFPSAEHCYTRGHSTPHLLFEWRC